MIYTLYNIFYSVVILVCAITGLISISLVLMILLIVARGLLGDL